MPYLRKLHNCRTPGDNWWWPFGYIIPGSIWQCRKCSATWEYKDPPLYLHYGYWKRISDPQDPKDKAVVTR